MSRRFFRVVLSIFICPIMAVCFIANPAAAYGPDKDDVCQGIDVPTAITSVSYAPESVTDAGEPAGEVKDPNPPSGLTGGGAPLATGGPDAFGYAYIDSNEAGGPVFSWVDITGTGTQVLLTDDDWDGPFPIGFSFPFYGVAQTQFYTSSNGHIDFGAGSSSLSNQCTLPNSTTPNDLIALMWDDLDPGDTSDPVYYQYFPACPVGSGPCTVVEYYDFCHYPGGASCAKAGTWEAILYPAGNILIQFLDAGAELGSGSTTGIENTTGTIGLGYACNAASSLSNNLAVLYYLPKVTLAATNQSGCPGDVVSYTVTITNNTGASTSFDLAYSGNVWPVSGPASVGPLAASTSTTFTVTHTITGAPGESDSFTITATDQSNAANVATKTMTTSASANWTALPAMTTGVSRPAGAVVDGKFYILGGESSAGYLGLVQIYDPGTGSWSTSAATMPTGASNITAAAIGTDIYVPGGGAGVAGNQLQVYSTVADSWTTVTTDPLPVALYAAACAAYGGKLYVFGGSTGAAVNTTYIYDPAAAAGSRWTAGLSAPVADYFGAAVPVGNLIFWTGLYSNSTAVYAYDPAANTWTTYPNLTTARGGAGAWVDGADLYVGAGGWTTYLNSVEVYDTTQGLAGTWTAGPSMVSGRRAFAPGSDTVNGRLYAGGGWNGAYLAAAEILEMCTTSGCAVTVAPATLPDPVAGVAYNQTVTASGGTAPYTYAVTVGALPPGLTLDTATGAISGMPTTGGTYTFTITATDSAMCTGTATYTFTLGYGWNLSVYDNTGRSYACLNTDTGYYEWHALTGFGAGTYLGRTNVSFINNIYYFQSGMPSGMNLKVNLNTNTASGYCFVPPMRERSICIDGNITDNPACP